MLSNSRAVGKLCCSRLRAVTDVGYSPDLGWTADGKAVTLLRQTFEQLIVNVWKFPLDGSWPKPLTNFKDASLSIDTYSLSRDGKSLAVVRSNSTSDLVLITGFK